MSADFDAVVIGAGVVGLAVARELSLSGHSVLVLEAAASPGTATSSRNSEVIHAGIYYPSGSLRARLCVEGRSLLYAYCARTGVAAKRVGKFIVATSQPEEAKLEAIKLQAEANGVPDLQWLTPAEVKSLEPEIRCTRALLSPSTGILDSKAYMLALQGEAEGKGASFAFQTHFDGASRVDGVFVVTASSRGGEATELTCTSIFNCAGHGAHEAARAIAGIDAMRLPPRFLARGSYCSVSGRPPFKRLVYPVPVAGALGIHATIDLAGAVRFGPDITWIDDLDYALAPDLPEKFAAAIETYWPSVRDHTLSPSYCGIRPKIHGPGVAGADFCIEGEAAHGVRNLVNMFGIESPGLTASLAIASHAAALAGMA